MLVLSIYTVTLAAFKRIKYTHMAGNMAYGTVQYSDHQTLYVRRTDSLPVGNAIYEACPFAYGKAYGTFKPLRIYGIDL